MLMMTQLTGFMMGDFVLTPPPAVATITKVSESEANNNNTLTMPSGIIAGDIIFYTDATTDDDDVNTDTTPSGFTKLATATVDINLENTCRCSLYVRLATGIEASQPISGGFSSPDGIAAKQCIVFRGDIPATSISAHGALSQGANSNPSPQTQSASALVAPLIIVGVYNDTTSPSAGSVNPRTFTVGGSPAKDGETEVNSSVFVGPPGEEIETGTDLWFAWKIYNSSPQDAVIDMDDEGLNILLSCTVRVL